MYREFVEVQKAAFGVNRIERNKRFKYVQIYAMFNVHNINQSFTSDSH